MKKQRTYRRLGAGIYEDEAGISAQVAIGTRPNLLREQTRFDRGTDLTIIRAWQRSARAALQKMASAGVVRRGTLDADMLEYLKTADISEGNRKRRAQQLTWWCDQKGDDGRRLGSRHRYTLKAPELLRVLKTLTRKDGSTAATNSTFNQYRMALGHLWKVLDGAGAPNPMRDIASRPGADALPRGIDYQIVRLILRHAPSRFGIQSAKTVARLYVFAYTGLTPAQIKLLQPGDFDLDGPNPSILSRGRRKGKGAPPRRKPLLAEGVLAMRMFVAVDAFTRDEEGRLGFGTFSTSSMRKTFLRARNRAEAELRKVDPTVDLSSVRLYDLRHSFGGLIYDSTGGDQVATQKWLDHRHLRTTDRYTLRQVEPHLQRAAEAAQKALAALPPEPSTSESKPTTSAQRAKLRVVQ